LQRREFLKLAALGAATTALTSAASAFQHDHPPILDTHIHLFDPTRPGGVPWPTKADSVLFKPALPSHYEALSKPFGVIGAIAIEASPLASDNDWLLNLVARHPIIVGIIGDLVPGSPSYTSDLNRLHDNPLFLGIRYGNLWNRDLAADLDKPNFLDGLKALAQASVVFESANPNPSLIAAILKVAEQVPNLRIVIDHLPHAPIPTEKSAREAYNANLRELAHHPGVFIKLSEIPEVANGQIITDPHHYQGPLDAIWDIFGEDQILFGSDWPNSDTTAPFTHTLSIVRNYIATKSTVAQQKYFFHNSLAAYHWHPRRSNQTPR
jgi:L-fuconolactonase